ncbi:hypothetical protein WJR50_10735 [Catalinimonas sp. 4WD22]|uniref:hypothetical protein n=1 Tax=Catalinimonas locisalis TaxID=3133978 RepID=UPI00310147C8
MNQVSKISGIRWMVVLFFLLTIIMNYIAQINPFNGQTNGEVSDKYSTLITPADYAFSIWGIIYLALGIYVFYQALWAPTEQKVFDKIGKWLIVSFITTSLWLPAFQYELLGLSVLIMLVILLSLIMTNIILLKDKTIMGAERVLLKIPFGLYLGWISVATIVNTTVLLKYTTTFFLSASEILWLWIILAVGFILVILVTKFSRNVSVSLVFAWAYFAIGNKESQTEDTTTIAIIAAIVLLVVSAIFAFQFYSTSRKVGFGGR